MGRSRFREDESDGVPAENDGHELKRKKSELKRLQRKRAKNIHKGIDKYFEKRKLKEELGEEIDDDELDFFDEEDEDTCYRH